MEAYALFGKAGTGEEWQMCVNQDLRTIWIKAMTNAINFYQLSKGRDRDFMCGSLELCPLEVTVNIST